MPARRVSEWRKPGGVRWRDDGRTPVEAIRRVASALALERALSKTADATYSAGLWRTHAGRVGGSLNCLRRPTAQGQGGARSVSARRVETAWRGMSIDGVGYNLYRVRRTLHEMLKDRGYLIDQADIDLSEEDFKEQHGEVPSREQLTILVQKRDDPTEQVYVFWPTDPKVGVKPIKR